MRAFFPSLARIARVRDTVGFRVGVALVLCMLASFTLAAAIGYWKTSEALERKEVEWMNEQVVEVGRRVAGVSEQFAKFVSELAKEEVVSTSLVDTLGRDRYLLPYLRLVESTLARQFDSGSGGLGSASVSILDYRGDVIGTASGAGKPSYRGAPWVAKVMGGIPAAFHDEGGGVLMVAYPIVFASTGRPEGIAVGRIGLDELSRFASSDRWSVALGTKQRVDRLVADPALRTVSQRIEMEHPYQALDWHVALGYPVAVIEAEARKTLWLYFFLILGSALPIALAGTLIGRRIGLPMLRLAAEARQLADPASLDRGGDDALAEGATVEAKVLARSLQEARIKIRDSTTAMGLARSALDSARYGIVIADALSSDLALIYVNDAFVRMSGYSREEALGRNCRFLHAGDRTQPEIRTLRTAIRAGESCQVALRNFRKDGSEFWNELSIAPIRDAQGTLIHYVGIQKDVTDRRRTEQMLREAQKLEAIGQLTGGLAHDFNNLLGVVVGNLDFLGDKLPGDKHQKAALDAALRGAEVTRSLLAVARRQPLEVAGHDLNELLGEMVPLLRSSAGSSVTLVPALSEGSLVARLDAGGLSNVVLNLVINARDAMREMGRERVLTVRTLREAQAEGNVLGLTAGGYAVLEVEDTGSGMSEEVRAQAFEPFFTTKERGKGTGLGLAMVYGYAEQLGGTARIVSEPGVGTKVRVYLPLEAAGEARVAEVVGAEPAQAAAAEQKAWRVLVVDDEVGLSELACVWLGSLGYEAEGVNSPAEALERLKAGTYDVLFTDVVMPGGMDGIALAREARSLQPGLRVQLTSGYARTLLEEASTPWPVLSKPYRKSDLERSIGAVLATEPEAT